MSKLNKISGQTSYNTHIVNRMHYQLKHKNGSSWGVYTRVSVIIKALHTVITVQQFTGANVCSALDCGFTHKQ